MHDRKVNTTTNGAASVKDKTLSELKMLDAGKGQRIPTADEVLDLINSKVGVNIELNGPGTAMKAARLISLYLNKGWDLGNFLVSSFSFWELRRFKSFDCSAKTGLLFEDFTYDIFRIATGLDCYSINPRIDLVNKRFVEYAHRVGLKVFPYTANSPEDIRRLKEMGADGLFSDFPDRL